MKKNYLRNITMGLILLVSAASCKKLIEIPSPSNKITGAQLFSDSASTMSAVAGIYNNLGAASNFGNLVFTNGLITQATGLSSDELSTTNFGDVDLQELEKNTLLSDNGSVASLWKGAYTALYQINACLEGISSSTGISASLKQQLTGEIKVIRALYYFNMVNLYGGVPLVTTSNYLVNATLPRATPDAVFAQMIADLTDAETKLKAAYPSGSHARPNLYAASALLARIYLYQGEWQKAYDLANQVINSGTYQLEPQLNNVFLDGSAEAIWQLPANGSNYQTPEAVMFVPSSNNVPPRFPLTSILLNAFENGDQRKNAWVDSMVVAGTTQSYAYAYKYKNRAASSATTEDYMVLRLAEQYLIRAEASAHLGNLTNAVADLNMIHNPDRVGLPIYAGLTDQASVLNTIIKERQVELFCEWGNRWYDLKRTGTAGAVLSAEKGITFNPNQVLYPVPIAEIRTNPYLKQNPGYN